MSTLWHWIVIVVVLGMIGACVWLLLANSRRKNSDAEDTGHVWDGDLRELNNPLPRWWFNLFLISAIFGLLYLVIYPGLGNLPGVLGWSERASLSEGLASIRMKHDAAYAAFKGKDVLALSQDARANAVGHDIFLRNCAGCHGADARGARGFPNLTDSDWLYGGTPEEIVASITNGRNGQMPAFKGVVVDAAIDDLTETVMHWSDGKEDKAAHDRGMKQFMTTCFACHGPDGKGNKMIGSANLTDDIWLHGGSRERVRESILMGRKSAMPAHRDILAADDINLVAAYVYSLSHAP